MTTVRQILAGKPHRSLISIASASTVFDALSLMARHDIGALVVLDGERLRGIFSERDYARKVMLLGRSSREVRVEDIMSSPVQVVGPDDTIETCMETMTAHRVRHLPVCDGPRVVGLVSIGDVVKGLLVEQQFVIRQLEQYVTT